MPPLRCAILISGSGRTLENLARGIRAKRLRLEIAGVLSSRRDAYGLVRAKRLGLPSKIVRPKDFRNRRAFWKTTAEALDAWAPDFVVMAGYLCYWRIPKRYAGRVVNIHPSLLPAFGGKGCYGHLVHEQVIAAGVKVSGCTVHAVDDVYDHGKILGQVRVKVLRRDTPDSLARRVFRAETALYPKVLERIACGRIRLPIR